MEKTAERILFQLCWINNIQVALDLVGAAFSFGLLIVSGRVSEKLWGLDFSERFLEFRGAPIWSVSGFIFTEKPSRGIEPGEGGQRTICRPTQ